jgi:dihydroorotate dehydrogenase (fumarate)
MINLSTTYLGLPLRSPIIAGSSGITNNIRNIIELDKQGVGAVVLKSLFEEQILNEASKTLHQGEGLGGYPEALDYIGQYTRHNALNEYLNLIRECKKAVSMPIIASINCVSASEWIQFAYSIQEAGADAIELNIFLLPSDPYRSAEDHEAVYFQIIDAIKSKITIPVSIKISPYFSGLAKTAIQLSWTGIKGIVLFNRFFSPDIDIENETVASGFTFSNAADIAMPLRWVAMLRPRVQCDLCASSGVDSGEAVVKLLLAGANAVQTTSALYKHGTAEIGIMNNFLADWMTRKGYQSIAEFNGKLSIENAVNPAAYERVQFMKHFAGIE